MSFSKSLEYGGHALVWSGDWTPKGARKATLALGEVLRLVNDGFTSGFDLNKSGVYRFSIS